MQWIVRGNYQQGPAAETWEVDTLSHHLTICIGCDYGYGDLKSWSTSSSREEWSRMILVLLAVMLQLAVANMLALI